MKKTLAVVYVMAGLACAQVTEFRLGHLSAWLFDVLGFNLLDLVSDTSTLIFLFFLLVMVGIVVAVLLWKKH
jgi:hypothetical protein